MVVIGDGNSGDGDGDSGDGGGDDGNAVSEWMWSCDDVDGQGVGECGQCCSAHLVRANHRITIYVVPGRAES